MRIAILEDDSSQLELLTHWLRLAGHEPCAFERGGELLRALESGTFDVVLLDWNVPDMSGIAVLRHIRERLQLGTPALFCTARGSETDVVEALRSGADDYLIKPLRRMELVARLETISRRGKAVLATPEVMEVGEFRVDVGTRRLFRNDEALRLTSKDFDLAVLLLRNVGRILSRRHIREQVWQTTAQVSSRTLDTHVSRVRSRLYLRPVHGWQLSAVYGLGYRLDQTKDNAPRPSDGRGGAVVSPL